MCLCRKVCMSKGVHLIMITKLSCLLCLFVWEKWEDLSLIEPCLWPQIYFTFFWSVGSYYFCHFMSVWSKSCAVKIRRKLWREEPLKLLKTFFDHLRPFGTSFKYVRPFGTILDLLKTKFSLIPAEGCHIKRIWKSVQKNQKYNLNLH